MAVAVEIHRQRIGPQADGEVDRESGMVVAQWFEGKAVSGREGDKGRREQAPEVSSGGR